MIRTFAFLIRRKLIIKSGQSLLKNHSIRHVATIEEQELDYILAFSFLLNSFYHNLLTQVNCSSHLPPWSQRLGVILFLPQTRVECCYSVIRNILQDTSSQVKILKNLKSDMPLITVEYGVEIWTCNFASEIW